MGSLADLNTYAQEQVEYSDARDPGIVLDPPSAEDVSKTILERQISVITPVEIAEIIDTNPILPLNLKYSVDISSVSGATLEWTGLFANSITEEVDQVYSVYPIQTTNDWNLVKSPEITIPNDFQGSFQYTVTLSYRDNQGLQEVSWTVGNYAPLGFLENQFSVTINTEKFKGFGHTTLTAFSSFIGVGIELDIAEADLTSEFSFAATGDRAFRGYSANINANALIGVVPNADFIGRFSKTANFSLDADVSTIPVISNGTLDRIFFSNRGWPTFNFDTPVISDNGGVNTYRIELSSDNGDFGTETDITVGTYTFTGSKTNVNNHFQQIYFYPDKDFAADTTFNFKLYKNNILAREYTPVLDHAGAGFTGTTYTFTSNSSWTPSDAEIRYCEMDYLLVAGGGGMSLIPDPQPDLSNFKGNTAGGGGEVLYALSQTIADTTYNLTIGSGGTRGGAGGNTAGFGLTALGGEHGVDTATLYEINGTFSNEGGSSGNGNLGNREENWRDGGYGGGAGGAAPSLSGLSSYGYPNNGDQGPGPGVNVSSIDTTIYGVGGQATYSNRSPERINTASSITAGSGGGEDGTGFGCPGAGQDGIVKIRTFS